MIKRYLFVALTVALVGIMAGRSTGQRDEPPHAYRTADEVAAKDPELLRRLVAQSREAPRLKRAATYDPMDDPTYHNRLPLDIKELSKPGIPAAFLLQTHHWAPYKPEATGETDQDQSAWVRTDGSLTRLGIGYRSISSLVEALQGIKNGSAAIYTAVERDEFGAGQSSLTSPQYKGTSTIFVGYDTFLVQVKISAADDPRTESFHAEITEADRLLVWNLARLTLAYQVAKSLIADPDLCHKTNDRVVPFRRISASADWTLKTPGMLARTYVANCKTIELMAGACRAKVNGQVVNLQQIIAANDDDWFIADEDISLLTK